MFQSGAAVHAVLWRCLPSGTIRWNAADQRDQNCQSRCESASHPAIMPRPASRGQHWKEPRGAMIRSPQPVNKGLLLPLLFSAACGGNAPVHTTPDQSRPHITWEIRTGGEFGDDEFVCGSAKPAARCTLTANTNEAQIRHASPLPPRGSGADKLRRDVAGRRSSRGGRRRTTAT